MPRELTAESRTKALESILAGPATKLAPIVRQSAVLLGFLALTPGVDLPPALTAIAVGLGINAMSSIIDQVALRNDTPQDQITQAVENAVRQSGLDQSLTTETFFHAYSHLLKVVRSVQEQNADIAATLARLESIINRLAGAGTESQSVGFSSEVLASLPNLSGESSLFLRNPPGIASAAIPGDASEISQAALQTEAVQAGQYLAVALSGALGQIDLRSLMTSVVGPRPDSGVLAPVVFSSRRKVVTDLSTTLSKVDCLALVGGPGSGKSQLGRALVEASGANAVRWVNLGDRRDPGEHLEEQLALWFAELAKSDLKLTSSTRMTLGELAEQISQFTGQNGILLIDDLPDPAENDLLFKGIEEVLTAFAHYGSKIITTSQREFPSNLGLHGGARIALVRVQPFDDIDVREMLERAGAPLESISGDPAALILGTTYGNPLLVAATVDWMKRHDWRIGKDELMGILGGEPTAGIRDEQMRRLPRFLEEQPRHLLYRLSLLQEAFDKTLAMSIAGIAPAINYPGESLQELVGPSLDRLEEDKHKINPLLKDAGVINLPQAEQREVHRVTAHYFLSKRIIEASQVSSIALHLWGAGDLKEWVGFIVQVTMNVKTESQAKYFGWISRLYGPDTKWPDGLDLTSKILLRAAQVKIRSLAGGNPNKLAADLDSLIDQAKPDDYPAVIFALGITGPFLAQRAADIAMRNAVRMVRLLHQTGIMREKELGVPLEDIVWITVARLEGATGVRQFVSELERMTDAEKTKLFEAPLATEATSYLIDAAWISEAAKPVDQRNWAQVLQWLDEIGRRADEWKLTALQVAAVRAYAVIQGDYLGNRPAAIDTIRNIPRPTNSDLLFLLDYTAGCQLYDAGELPDALTRLEQATAAGGTGFSYYRMNAKMLMTVIQGKLGRMAEGLTQGISAIHAAAAITNIAFYEKLEMMGELAWIRWQIGSRKRAFGALYGLIKGLTNSWDEKNPRFREVFNKAGHALGWYVKVATTGQRPSLTADGSEFIPPEQGFFAIRREGLQGYSPPRGFSKALLLMQLGLLADAVALPHSAWDAFERSSFFLENDVNKPLLDGLKFHRAALATRLGKLESALTLGIQGARALAVSRRSRQAGVEASTATLSPEDAWRSCSQEERAEFGRQLLWFVVGPAFAELLSANVVKDEALHRIAALHERFIAHAEELQDAHWWDEVFTYLGKLILIYSADEKIAELPAIPDGNGLLGALRDFAISKSGSTRLVDSFVQQVNGVSFLIAYSIVATHMMPGIGKFIHAYWVDTAALRGFALSSPRLVREQLNGIAPDDGARTAVRVLKVASSAMGVAIPKNILDVLNQEDRAN